MKCFPILIAVICCLSGCNTIPVVNVASAATCVTEVATKGSKFSCEFEGEKVFAKK